MDRTIGDGTQFGRTAGPDPLPRRAWVVALVVTAAVAVGGLSLRSAVTVAERADALQQAAMDEAVGRVLSLSGQPRATVRERLGPGATFGATGTPSGREQVVHREERAGVVFDLTFADGRLHGFSYRTLRPPLAHAASRKLRAFHWTCRMASGVAAVAWLTVLVVAVREPLQRRTLRHVLGALAVCCAAGLAANGDATGPVHFDPRSPLPWIALFMAAAGALVPLLPVRRRRRDTPPRCGRCEYNLTGNVSGRCPECGTFYTARCDVETVSAAIADMTRRNDG